MCVNVKNFVKIGQTVAEIPCSTVFKMAAVGHLRLLHWVDCVLLLVACAVCGQGRVHNQESAEHSDIRRREDRHRRDADDEQTERKTVRGERQKFSRGQKPA